ncbi:MAG: cell wall-binding repeat-containing protein [Microbacterium sp.]|nr:cell wall-binding repeat-containing protein [Microbacterium sp.]
MVGLAALAAIVAGISMPAAAHAAAATGAVHGIVTGAHGEPIHGWVTVRSRDFPDSEVGSAILGSDGSFAVTGLVPSVYAISVRPDDASSPNGTYPGQYLGGVKDLASSRTVTVAAGSNVDQDVRLVAGVHLVGTLSADPSAHGVSPADATVRSFNPSSSSPAATWDVGAGGSVTVTGTTYRSAPFLAGHADSATFSAYPEWLPTSVSYPASAPGSDVFADVHFSAAGWISGTITKDVDTPGFPDVYIYAVGGWAGDPRNTSGSPDASGHFAIGGLTPGAYTVEFPASPSVDTYTSFWPNAQHLSGAQPVTVTPGTSTEITAELHVGARLDGSVSIIGWDGSHRPVATSVEIYSRNDDGSLSDPIGWGVGDYTGSWHASTLLAPGDYVERFTPVSAGAGTFPPQFLGGLTASEATTVHASLGTTTTELVLKPAVFSSTRLGGADRYATAAAVADAVIPAGQHPAVVYLASGENFADSLSAGPAAAFDHTVVLTTRAATLPASTAAELARLHPSEVRIVGGLGAISAFVAARAGALTHAKVTRIAGADRYETSRKLAQAVFPLDASASALLATGRDYPDALAAGGVAAVTQEPVILIDGRAAIVDAATRRLLAALSPGAIQLVGGTGAISAGIEASFNGYAVRYAGADRYATATALNDAHSSSFDPQTRATVVSGATFADATVVAPLALARHTPIELSAPTCIPVVTMSSIIATDGLALTLVGGPGALNADVAKAHACSGPYQTGIYDPTSP